MNASREWICLAIVTVVLGTHASADDDVVVADFEGITYGDWKSTGEAFGSGPARGTLPGQMPVSGFLGKGLVNSFLRGDGATGTLTSPPIKLQRRYINFLIGGGGHAGKTCMNLIVDGKIVRTAAGPNTEPGGSEELDWQVWDVGEFSGKVATFQIVDEHKGGWGHINVDHIVQSDRRKTSGPATRELKIDARFLHLPVKTGAPMRRMKVVVDEQVVREFDIELADDPTFYVFADVSAFRDKKLSVSTSRLPEGSKALERIVVSGEIPEGAKVYQEKTRPQFHFTSRRGWLNDPNGLVFFEGEYHLFYQHNPYGWNWGNMHWGHAVSRDLVHWTELPEALYPPRHGDWCFSGSALVVRKGQAGFDRDVLVAGFTSTGRGECLVVSDDRGRTWKELPGNPVLKHAGRDPKLLWHEPTRRWVMAVYDELEGKRWIAFHSSPDLKQWRFESRIEGFFECPDLFELPISGQKESRWVLYGADGKYVLGDFDGKTFRVDSGKHQLWHGNFYAAQTFNDAPDSRRIQIGWGQGIAFPGESFNQQMTIPVELSLRRTSDGVRIFARPIRELEKLRHGERTWTGEVSDRKEPWVPWPDFKADLVDLEVDFRPSPTVAEYGVVVRGIPIRIETTSRRLLVRDIKVPLNSSQVKLRVLVDRGSMEIFVNEGEAAISVGIVAKDADRSVALSSTNGATRVECRAFDLKSSWQR